MYQVNFLFINRLHLNSTKKMSFNYFIQKVAVIIFLVSFCHAVRMDEDKLLTSYEQVRASSSCQVSLTNGANQVVGVSSNLWYQNALLNPNVTVLVELWHYHPFLPDDYLCQIYKGPLQNLNPYTWIPDAHQGCINQIPSNWDIYFYIYPEDTKSLSCETSNFNMPPYPISQFISFFSPITGSIFYIGDQVKSKLQLNNGWQILGSTSLKCKIVLC